ncbi:hypothetical protein ACFX1R_041709 [Malus domestica]|uniref:ribosomal RNA small subunit methyltransferase NEP1-like n=1 Tax=Malus domestica TaxID=3750 RepID=UPI0010AADE05|nr:ribosomal RNA small subunit methyltransferase nep-1-like [Malus domestica]
MVRWKRGQSESQSQNLSTRMVKRKLEEESTTTEEKTEDDDTHNATIRSPPNVERWKILDSEEDADFLKQKKVVNDYRPGVVYQALRSIFDSKLNKAGMAGAVYVNTDNGVLLFEIKPHVHIPTTKNV